MGYKTILHLALDEDDHDTTRYIEALLEAGASAKHLNKQLFSAPIHVAAEDVNLNNIKLLLQDPDNKEGLLFIQMLKDFLSLLFTNNYEASEANGINPCD